MVEAKEGKPFVGKTGVWIRQMLFNAGLPPQELFITNALCCRPPENRDPTVEEMEACWQWTEEQADSIKPRVVVAVGRFAARMFIEPLQTGKQSMGDLHGTPCWSALFGYPMIVYPTYHPAAGLHNPDLKEVVAQDFQRLGGLMQRLYKEHG